MAVDAPSDLLPHAGFDGAAAAIASARRAAVADRYAVGSLAVEWRELAQLRPIAEEWRALAARSWAPNVFYEPAFALAAAPVFGRGVGAILVWSGGGPRKLLGFFPARIETRRYGIKLPILVGWTHPYAPLGLPLVDREAAVPVLAAWLEYLAGNSALPGLVLWPFVPADGPIAETLATALRRAQLPAADFNCHRRALLAPSGEREHYLQHALSAHKFRELRRAARRLSERGAVMFTTASEQAAIAAATDDFLALEVGGWKGEAGTAAAQHPAIERFMRSGLGALAAEGKAFIDRILLDGRAIAAAIVLRSSGRAWFWKIAYDEQFASCSPGVMLAVALTEELLDDARVVQADSCAIANHPMIDPIWRERLALCDRMIAVRANAPFAFASRLESLRTASIRTAKRIRARFAG